MKPTSHAFGVDNIACPFAPTRPAFGGMMPRPPLPFPAQFSEWVTSTERYGVILDEYRRVPLALLVSSVILLAIGPRHDLSVLGPLLAWGVSAAQFVLAIALVWIAAHESTPAGRLPRQIVYSAAAAR